MGIMPYNIMASTMEGYSDGQPLTPRISGLAVGQVGLHALVRFSRPQNPKDTAEGSAL